MTVGAAVQACGHPAGSELASAHPTTAPALARALHRAARPPAAAGTAAVGTPAPRLGTVRWPATGAAALPWAQLLLLWVVLVYVVGGNTPLHVGLGRAAGERIPAGWRGWTWVRVVAAALVPWPMLGVSWGTGAVSVLLAGGILVLIHGRHRLATRPPHWHGGPVGLVAEWELLINGAVVLGLGLLLGRSQLIIAQPWVVVPLPPHRLALICAVTAGLAFVAQAGTHVVRGLLDKTGTLPHPAQRAEARTTAPPLQPTALAPQPPVGAGDVVGADGTVVDTGEYNRGRVIGTLERVIMTALVALGRYEALAFLIAAKGFIRAKALEDRDFAEYFIVGTLASAGLALAVGLVLQGLLRWW